MLGVAVGSPEGVAVGPPEGSIDGEELGFTLGPTLGLPEGSELGTVLGTLDGACETQTLIQYSSTVGHNVGAAVGLVVITDGLIEKTDGLCDGETVGADEIVG